MSQFSLLLSNISIQGFQYSKFIIITSASAPHLPHIWIKPLCSRVLVRLLRNMILFDKEPGAHCIKCLAVIDGNWKLSNRKLLDALASFQSSNNSQYLTKNNATMFFRWTTGSLGLHYKWKCERCLRLFDMSSWNHMLACIRLAESHWLIWNRHIATTKRQRLSLLFTSLTKFTSLAFMCR